MNDIIKDSGKIRIQVRDGIPIIDVYHDGELMLEDISWIKRTLVDELSLTPQPPIDIIVDRNGSYSLSADAYINMQQMMREANHVAYVIHAPSQNAVVDLAANSYLADKPVEKFSSLEEAIGWIKGQEQNGRSIGAR